MTTKEQVRLQESDIGESVSIEFAKEDDIEEIFQLHKEVYVSTYTGVTSELTEEAIRDHVNHEAFRERRIKKLKKYIHSNTNGAVFVARSEGSIIGYAATAINETTGLRELESLYVDPQKRGTGKRLLHAVKDWHQKHPTRGDNAIYLLVAPRTSAVDFYLSQGFRLSGKYSGATLEGGQYLPLMKMQTPKRR